jgi:LysM repeat protein
MRIRLIPFFLCALAALLFTAGCGRYESSPFTAEIDEPNYRRGKDLLRQGRNQEALSSFLKVVEKRGDDAPESHLELGILYQQHIKDPIAAIYHYRKFRELKRNSPQSDLVRQRIDAATREFARTLPAQPLDNQMDKLDLLEKIDLLQRENLQLKEQLIGVRTQAINTPRPAPVMTDDAEEQLAPLAIDPSQSPIAAAPEPLPAMNVATPTPVPPDPEPAPAASGRRYVVQKGDSLFAIAKKHYGQATNARVQGILNANRNVLPSAAALQPGMTLVIP